MRIGILGAGRMGGTLGSLLAATGHQVTFAYARSREKLERLAAAAGPGGRVGTPSEVVAEADLVLLAVHWLQLDDVLEQAGSLAGRTVLSCCNPLDADDRELLIGHSDSGAENLARRLPNSRLVAAFQATPSEVLRSVYDNRADSLRPSQLFCGDDATAKAQVAGLITELGFEPVDAGPLRVARYLEPFGMLSGVLAYETDQGPEWAYRCARLDRLFEMTRR